MTNARYKSRVLQALDETRRPPADVVCTTCARAMWFMRDDTLHCYCREQYALVWSSTTDQTRPIACSGYVI